MRAYGSYFAVGVRAGAATGGGVSTPPFQHTGGRLGEGLTVAAAKHEHLCA